MIIVQIELWSDTDAELSDLAGNNLHLTAREQEVLGCLRKGFTNKEIAQEPDVRRIMVQSQTSTRMRLVASCSAVDLSHSPNCSAIAGLFRTAILQRP
jgi:DNA-binding NarL/FixJ family response regulator